MQSGRFDAVVLDLCDSHIELHIDEFLRLHSKVLLLACERPIHGILLPQGYRPVIEKPVDLELLEGKLRELLADKVQ